MCLSRKKMDWKRSNLVNQLPKFHQKIIVDRIRLKPIQDLHQKWPQNLLNNKCRMPISWVFKFKDPRSRSEK